MKSRQTKELRDDVVTNKEMTFQGIPRNDFLR